MTGQGRTRLGSILVNDVQERSRKSAIVLITVFLITTSISYIALNHNLRITSALVYVIGIMAIGSMTSVRTGLMTALFASAFYNFFLSEPLWSFYIDSYDDLMPHVAFSVTAIFTGVLAGRLTERAREAEIAQARMTALLGISGKLQQAVSLEDIAHSLQNDYWALKVGNVTLFDQNGRALGEGADLPPEELGLVDQRGMRTEGANGLSLVAIWLQDAPVAILRLQNQEDQAQGRSVHLEALVNLIRLAVERCILLKTQSDMEILTRSEETKSAILSSISHDMRTPLAAISASASSLISLPAMLEQSVKEKLLDTIVEQCARLNRYTSNLLELGRIQAGIDELSLTNIDFTDILGAVISRFRSSYPEFEIIKSFDAKPRAVRANEVMIEQVLENIFDNAIRYSGDYKMIRVSVKEKEGQLSVSIEDCGVGISSHDLPHVFDRFYRGDRTENYAGSGLGLAIAKGFVERFGGTIRITSPSSQGSGTTLEITLPTSKVESLR
jgi:two-component system sensor histidine kinase KdpD